jgi:hypothetical protein
LKSVPDLADGFIQLSCGTEKVRRSLVVADRRQEERKEFHMSECEGTFTLEVDDELFEIENVFDISLSGMGVETQCYLDPGKAVTITYEEDDCDVSVTGTVTWCEDDPESHGDYRVGILFDYSYRDKNSLLFMAVRKYLDTFDTVGS